MKKKNLSLFSLAFVAVFVFFTFLSWIVPAQQAPIPTTPVCAAPALSKSNDALAADIEALSNTDSNI